MALNAISENSDTKESVVLATCRLVDKSVTKGILKKNTAARKKSKLMKSLNASASK